MAFNIIYLSFVLAICLYTVIVHNQKSIQNYAIFFLILGKLIQFFCFKSNQQHQFLMYYSKVNFVHTGEQYAAAKSLQSCLTLCNPMDCSLQGSSIHGIFQARELEWGAIAFSWRTVWRFFKKLRLTIGFRDPHLSI